MAEIKYFDREAALDVLPQELAWSHMDNYEYYNNWTPEIQQEILFNSGLHQNDDLKQLTSYINAADSVLEVGAAFGRVVHALFDGNFKGHIAMVEMCQVMVNYLDHQFKGKADVISGDLLEIKFPQQYDLILHLWNGISSFSQEEQFRCIQKMSSLLNPDGHLVIDLYRSSFDKKMPTVVQNRNYAIRCNDTIHYGYVPMLIELLLIASSVGLRLEKSITYDAQKQCERILLIFRKAH